MTPAGGVLRTIKKETDPVKRETDPGADPEEGEWGEVRRLVNEVKAQLPGYSATLPPRRNLWGDPLEVPKGWGVSWLSPVATSVAKNDPAGDEIVRLGRLGFPTPGRAPRVVLGRDPESVTLGEQASPLDTGIELTDSEYDEFVRLAGNELKVDGMGLHARLNELVVSDKEFRHASDALRATLIMRWVTAYRRAAVAELLDRNPGLLETYEQRIGTKAGALGAGRAPSAPAQTPPRSRPRSVPNIGVGPR